MRYKDTVALLFIFAILFILASTMAASVVGAAVALGNGYYGSAVFLVLVCYGMGVCLMALFEGIL